MRKYRAHAGSMFRTCIAELNPFAFLGDSIDEIHVYGTQSSPVCETIAGDNVIAGVEKSRQKEQRQCGKPSNALDSCAARSWFAKVSWGKLRARLLDDIGYPPIVVVRV